MKVTVTNISNVIVSGPLGLMNPGDTLSDSLFAARRLELIGKDLAGLAAQGLVRYSITDDPFVPDAAEVATRGDTAGRFFSSGILYGTGALQYIPHGLGVTPKFVQIFMLDVAPAVAAAVTVVEGWSTGITADGSGLLGGTQAGTGTSATATLLFAGVTSGNVIVYINGVPVSTPFNTSNNQTATDVATNVAAAFPNILASAAGSPTVTLTALKGGLAGNSISVGVVCDTAGTCALNGGTAAASVSGFLGTGTATAGADTVKAQGTVTLAPTVLPVAGALVGFTLGALTVAVPWAGSRNATATALAAAANALPAFNKTYKATASTNTVVVEAQTGGAYSNLVPFAPYGSHDPVNLVFNVTNTKRFKVMAFA